MVRPVALLAAGQRMGEYRAQRLPRAVELEPRLLGVPYDPVRTLPDGDPRRIAECVQSPAVRQPGDGVHRPELHANPRTLVPRTAHGAAGPALRVLGHGQHPQQRPGQHCAPVVSSAAEKRPEGRRPASERYAPRHPDPPAASLARRNPAGRSLRATRDAQAAGVHGAGDRHARARHRRQHVVGGRGLRHPRSSSPIP